MAKKKSKGLRPWEDVAFLAGAVVLFAGLEVAIAWLKGRKELPPGDQGEEAEF